MLGRYALQPFDEAVIIRIDAGLCEIAGFIRNNPAAILRVRACPAAGVAVAITEKNICRRGGLSGSWTVDSEEAL